ncbi:hypothetical protein GCM10009648_35460 [Tsukamurella spumae]
MLCSTVSALASKRAPATVGGGDGGLRPVYRRPAGPIEGWDGGLTGGEFPPPAVARPEIVIDCMRSQLPPGVLEDHRGIDVAGVVLKVFVCGLRKRLQKVWRPEPARSRTPLGERFLHR